VYVGESGGELNVLDKIIAMILDRLPPSVLQTAGDRFQVRDHELFKIENNICQRIWPNGTGLSRAYGYKSLGCFPRPAGALILKLN